MLNIMNYGKRFLKIAESEDLYPHNSVQIESNGLIDPYLAVREGSSSLCKSKHEAILTRIRASGKWCHSHELELSAFVPLAL